MPVPYEGATSGAKAREEITKILRQFGCSSVGFMDDFDKGELLLAFMHREQPMQLRASGKGWSALYIRENPWNNRMRRTRQEYEQWAVKQGMIAINSILRDWVKGQVAAVECGILSFEVVFFPYMLGSDGVPMLEKIKPLLLAAPAA